jgi:hypothetical protein
MKANWYSPRYILEIANVVANVANITVIPAKYLNPTKFGCNTKNTYIVTTKTDILITDHRENLKIVLTIPGRNINASKTNNTDRRLFFLENMMIRCEKRIATK